MKYLTQVFLRCFFVVYTLIPGISFAEELNGLYYFFEKVDENNKDLWKTFTNKLKAYHQTRPSEYGGEENVWSEHGATMNELSVTALESFQEALINISNKDVWVAYATTQPQPLRTLKDLEKHTVIFVSVTHCGNVTSHFGIYGNKRLQIPPRQGSLSLKLHGFAAKKMLELSHPPSYMMVVPIGRMLGILQNLTTILPEDSFKIFKKQNQKLVLSLCGQEDVDSTWFCRKEAPNYYERDKGEYEMGRASVTSETCGGWLFSRVNEVDSTHPLFIFKLSELAKLFR